MTILMNHSLLRSIRFSFNILHPISFHVCNIQQGPETDWEKYIQVGRPGLTLTDAVGKTLDS